MQTKRKKYLDKHSFICQRHLDAFARLSISCICIKTNLIGKGRYIIMQCRKRFLPIKLALFIYVKCRMHHGYFYFSCYIPVTDETVNWLVNDLVRQSVFASNSVSQLYNRPIRTSVLIEISTGPFCFSSFIFNILLICCYLALALRCFR